MTTVDASKIDAAAAGVGRVVYFDFDSYVLKDEFRPVIEGNARMLSSVKTKKMVVEGHTDERGGREYNLALGQRRAATVRRYLADRGVAAAHLDIVSLGEERPVCSEQAESCRGLNRRGEFRFKLSE